MPEGLLITSAPWAVTATSARAAAAIPRVSRVPADNVIAIRRVIRVCAICEERRHPPRVPGHLAEVVHHREIGAGGGGLTEALDQPPLVSAREARCDVVK